MVARSGFGFFRTSRSPRSRPKPEWVPAKAIRNIGLPLSSLAGSCSKLLEFREKALRKRLRRAAMKMPMDCKFVERLIAGADAAAAQEELMHQYEHYVQPATQEEVAEAAEAEAAAEEAAAAHGDAPASGAEGDSAKEGDS